MCTLIVVLALLIWLIYRPRTMKVAVAAATLARFDLDTTIPTSPVLSYNLTARLVISNPNRRVSIYAQLRAMGFYQAEPFGQTALPVSFQGTRHADTVPAVLAGASSMGIGDSGIQEFHRDENNQVFPVDLSASPRLQASQNLKLQPRPGRARAPGGPTLACKARSGTREQVLKYLGREGEGDHQDCNTIILLLCPILCSRRFFPWFM